jgi:Fe-Mn family superoxide dismutase
MLADLDHIYASGECLMAGARECLNHAPRHIVHPHSLTLGTFHHNLPLDSIHSNLRPLTSDFLDAFRAAFEKAGATLFGSGWVWLSADADGQLEISQEPNASNPITRGRTPLLTFDVWEHAYYLDYQNRRPAHLSALWSIINWEEVERRYVG